MEVLEVVKGLDEVFYELTHEWFSRRDKYKVYHSRQIFTEPIICFLGIMQKLDSKNSLASALSFLADSEVGKGLARFLGDNRRIKHQDISLATGGACRARARLSYQTIIELFEELNKKLTRMTRQETKGASDQHWYLLDGSTIGLARTAAIKEQFATTSNQNRECAPSARVVLAHNLHHGRAEFPAIGQITDSEQKLTMEILPRLPKGSGLLADRNFGIFSVVHHAHKHRLAVVVRLTQSRAQKLVGKENIDKDGTYPVQWTPSKKDRSANPEIEAAACVAGKVILATVTRPGFRAERFFIFTTTNLPAEEILEIYKKRWWIENDIRTLKKTVNLDVIHAKEPETAKKEILFGIIAYNLIRALIVKGAVKAGLSPRDISFTRAIDVIKTTALRISRSTTPLELETSINSFYRAIKQIKHPKRKKQRVKPRALATSRKSRFPGISGTREEARNDISKA